MSRAGVLEWLASREPHPPDELAAAVAEAVRSAPDACITRNIPQTLAAVARQTLMSVLGAASKDRATARRLLVADALVTYALEAQSEEGDPRTLERFALELGS